MNKVILMGRLTRDPETRYTQGQDPIAVARYSIAVDRPGKKKETDFINCVAFGKRGEFAEKYLHKGMKIAVSGRIQTGNYTNRDGKKVYATDVVVEEHYFCESKVQENMPQETTPQETDEYGFMDIPDNIEEELPFV